MNALLWGLAIAIIGAGFYGNHLYGDVSLPIRALGMVVVFGVAIGALSQTTHGKKLLRFIQESKIEMRKVVWPSRQETMQMTGFVLFVVTLVGIFLWGVDAALLRLVGWITGLGA